jgi:hypothetical protein
MYQTWHFYTNSLPLQGSHQPHDGSRSWWISNVKDQEAISSTSLLLPSLHRILPWLGEARNLEEGTFEVSSWHLVGTISLMLSFQFPPSISSFLWSLPSSFFLLYAWVVAISSSFLLTISPVYNHFIHRYQTVFLKYFLLSLLCLTYFSASPCELKLIQLNVNKIELLNLVLEPSRK